MEGSYWALDELRRNGLVTSIDVGVNESDVATRFLRSGRFDVLMMAGRYTLLDQGALADLLPEAERQGVELVAAGVFNSGILAKATNPTQSLTFDYRSAPADLVARTRAMVAVCARLDVPFQAAAIQFPLGHPSVAHAVLGIGQPGRVRQNLGWAATSLPTELWERLKAWGLIDPTAPVPPPGGVVLERP